MELIHGLKVTGYSEGMIKIKRKKLNKATTEFRGVRIDNAASTSSIMYKSQYTAYCDTFGSCKDIRPPDGRIVRGLGGRSPSKGSVIIYITFRDLDINIDVRLLLLVEDIPSLLSLKDMTTNQLDLSLLRCYIKLGTKEQKLSFTNYTLIHT